MNIKDRNVLESIRDAARVTLKLCDENEQAWIEVDRFRILAAKYKSLFYHKSDLANKLTEQMTENYNALIGEFDGTCYASWRANAVYRNLEDMQTQGIITKEEYDFCNE